MCGKFGKFINQLKVEYLTRTGICNDGEKHDDTAPLLDTFKRSKEIHFKTLSNMPLSLFGVNNQQSNNPFQFINNCWNEVTDHKFKSVTVSTIKHPNTEPINDPILANNKLASINEKAKIEQMERKMQKTDTLLILIAWVVLPVFRLCPEVIWCDVTSHSNNKGFHLFTLLSRTSIGKMVVFRWIWVPNVQHYSYCWIFSHTISTLIPLKIRK